MRIFVTVLTLFLSGCSAQVSIAPNKPGPDHTKDLESLLAAIKNINARVSVLEKGEVK